MRKFHVLNRGAIYLFIILLESDLQYSVPSPAGRCPSANAWDVFRVENLALEGFSNVVHKAVVAVFVRFCSFAFSARLGNKSATGATSGEINGHKFLYVTNFRSAKVELCDTN